MYLMTYTLGIEEIVKVLPDDFDENLLLKLIFIEAMSEDEKEKKPFLEMGQNEMATALFYAKHNDPVLIIGHEEHIHSNEWHLMKNQANVEFCFKDRLEEELLNSILKLQ